MDLFILFILFIYTGIGAYMDHVSNIRIVKEGRDPRPYHPIHLLFVFGWLLFIVAAIIDAGRIENMK